MDIAAVSSTERGRTDKVLADVAQALLGKGLRLAGLVQTNIERPGHRHCDMEVKVLPDGPVLRINQQLGEGAHGCRLDTGALENAVAGVEAMFAQEIDLLIVNKFGKHEAEGRGFRNLIAEALSRDIPVVVGVNTLNEDAFTAFVDDSAERLAADSAEIQRWCLSRLSCDAA
ncbi:DUF2478 domain-containing protein [Phaeovulum sp.]|uniref:DUF2478 domain-containing protein n=1 Tax=Phaeovulum sp. TaxID=2934796 RepID=UPI00356274AE